MEMKLTDFTYGRQGVADRLDPQSRWLIRPFAAIAKAGAAVRAEWRARRAAAELASLDDHMLRDIGVRRCEIQGLVRRPMADTARHAWQQRNRQVASN